MCPPYSEVVVWKRGCGRPPGAIHIYTIFILLWEEVLEFKQRGGGRPTGMSGMIARTMPRWPDGYWWRSIRRNPQPQNSVAFRLQIWPVAMGVCPKIGMRPRLRRLNVRYVFVILLFDIVELPLRCMTISNKVSKICQIMPRTSFNSRCILSARSINYILSIILKYFSYRITI